MSDQQLIEKIEALKADRNAIILAHNYQRDEVQEIADYTGDSLGLSHTGRQNRCRRDRFLRRALHGRNRLYSLPGKNRAHARP